MSIFEKIGSRFTPKVFLKNSSQKFYTWIYILHLTIFHIGIDTFQRIS